MAPPTIKERVNVAREHLNMSVEWKGEILGINEMKRHYSNYFKGIAHFKEYRTRLVTTMSLSDIYGIFDEVIEEFGDYEIFV